MTPQETRNKAQDYYNTFLDLWAQGAGLEWAVLTCQYSSKGEMFYHISIKYNGECYNLFICENDSRFENERMTEIIKQIQSKVNK